MNRGNVILGHRHSAAYWYHRLRFAILQAVANADEFVLECAKPSGGDREEAAVEIDNGTAC